MDVALLVLRVAVGVLLMAHGAQKLFGWFGGGGIAGTAGFFGQIGFRPPKVMAVLAGLGETGGGLLLALGLFNPLAAFAVMAVMLNASVPHWGNGPFTMKNGWELPLTFGLVGLAVAFAGPGAASLDNALGLELYGTGWGIAAIVAALVAGGSVVTMQRLNLRADSRATSSTGSPAQA